MRRKLFSLVLALALCLGLTVSAFADGSSGHIPPGGTSGSAPGVPRDMVTTPAVGKVGDTTLVDENGNIYTLSHPILAAETKTDLLEKGDIIYYAVPLGTVITAPAGAVWSGYNVMYYPDDGFNIYNASTGGLAPIPEYTLVGGEITGLVTDDIPFVIEMYSTVGFVYIHATAENVRTEPEGTTTPAFTDVKDGDYYAEAVKWAVEQSITSGTSATTFSPDETCTTAQILAFLWRAKGSPEPTIKNPFSNVADDAYYAKAAVWAYEQGLVSGNTFNQSAPCTRSMTVTYLWKLAGSPNAGISNFTDVPSNADYAQAVAWAVSRGITSGTSDSTFSPDATCTRGQIVTFLYRDFSK